MANFPNNPTPGQSFTATDGTNWVWNGSSWRSSGTGSGVPVHPADGNLYILDSTAIGDPTLRWILFSGGSVAQFSPGLNVVFANGDFSGSGTAEKGYVGANVNFTYTNSGSIAIGDSYDATLNSALITFTGKTGAGNTGNSTTGGNYVASIPEPATFSVKTKSTTNIVVTVSKALNWYYRVYWGTSTSTSLTEAAIKALSSNELKATRAGTYTFNTGGTEKYLYICYPSSYGAVSQITVNGFLVGFEQSTVSVTNTYGATTNYYVYKSPNTLTGAGISIVVS